MLVHVYRVESASVGIFYILLREDDYSITMSLDSVQLIREHHKAQPTFCNTVSDNVFAENDKEIQLLDTMPEEEVFPYLKVYTTLIGE